MKTKRLKNKIRIAKVTQYLLGSKEAVTWKMP